MRYLAVNLKTPRSAIRDARAEDGSALAAIYNPYIRETAVTFEEEPVSAEEMARRLHDVQSDGRPWLVAEREGAVVGFAYAGVWKARRSYRFAVESSVYLARGAERAGLGTALYDALFARLRAAGIHTVIGGISLPNEASVALHEKFGMRKVAHFPEVGWKLGRWIDVGYWQVVF